MEKPYEQTAQSKQKSFHSADSKSLLTCLLFHILVIKERKIAILMPLCYKPLIFVLQFYGSKRRFDQNSEIDAICQHITSYYLNHGLDDDESN